MDTVIKLAADGLMIPLVLVALYAFITRSPKAGRYDVYARVFMAGVTAYLLAKYIAVIWQPEGAGRPFERMGVAAGASFLQNSGFPSDHALFAAFLTFAVWYVTRSKKMGIAMAIMTILIGVGRVLALVHTPLDIAGGIVIAAIGAAIWYTPFTRIPGLCRRLAKKSKK